MAASRPLVELIGVTKRFPGQVALSGVNLSIFPGEIHALVGENGAGKSTLIKILSGALQLDSGEIRIDGQKVSFTSPAPAMQKGISTIYQDRILAPGLTVAENIALGHEPHFGRLFPLIDSKEIERRVRKVMSLLEFEIDINTKVKELSVAKQQLVAIAKALYSNTRLLILDEPTAPLAEEEIEHLFKVLRQLKAQGLGIIYITHRLEEVSTMADRVTVLKDGSIVCTMQARDVGKQELIKLMVGRELKTFFPDRSAERGREVLRIERLTRRGDFADVSLTLHAGEIVGLAGLVGSGRTPLARVLFGAEQPDSGQILLFGSPAKIKSPNWAVKAGIGFVPADRKTEGMVMGFSVKENVTLSSLGSFVRMGLVDGKKEAVEVEGYRASMAIRTPSIDTKVKFLSGGNQQKALIARSLCGQGQILIFDEPTCGVDVGAKAEIYNILSRLADEGAAILVISSELVELLGLCDRIIVMHRGRIAGEFAREEATEEKILHCAFIGTS